MKSEMFVPKTNNESNLQNKPDKPEKPLVLQNELLQALREDDGERLEEIKEKYEKEYPDQLEGVEAIFGIGTFLSMSSELNREDRVRNWEKDRPILRSLTEYQYLLTHYLLNAGKDEHDKRFLYKFWKVSEQIAEGAGLKENFEAIRVGILGQVASYRVLEALDLKPQLSHPELDAFYAVDLLAEEGMAVQVKTSRFKEKEPVLIKVENVGDPSIVIKGKNKQEIFINERRQKQLNKFGINLSKLGQKNNQTYLGYEFIIPSDLINPNTGQPDASVIEHFRDALKDEDVTPESYLAMAA